MIKLVGKYTTAYVMIDDIDDETRKQILSFIDHHAFTGPVAVMPDTHAGAGAVIGFTMPLGLKVIPNVIGVDIGCGMLFFSIGNHGFYEDMIWQELDARIRAKVPFGQNIHEEPVIDMVNEFPWEEVQSQAENFAVKYYEKFGIRIHPPKYNYEWFLAKCRQIGMDPQYAINSIGTMGGNNHFIELGRSVVTEENTVTIHTGSRNMGLKIANYWQNEARKDIAMQDLDAIIKDIKSKYSGKMIGVKINEARKNQERSLKNNKNLEWLEGEKAVGYFFDMIFAQIYAQVNRKYIAKLVLEVIGAQMHDSIETIHNFIDFNDFIIRKGAISAYSNERMIIPFNRKDGILICVGKDNPEWNFSAPHGAGRVMSRAAAHKAIDRERYNREMTGIHATDVGEDTIEEAPENYKPADIIEKAIEPTARIVDRLQVIHTFKAKSEEKFWMKKKRNKK